jgi:hypothetical protein
VFGKVGISMATLIGISVVFVLMASAYWLHGRLDGMVSKVEGKVRPHVPAMQQKVSAGLEAAKGYVRPRAAGWARRLALGCVAHLVVAFSAATCVALIRPAPQEVTYESIAKRSDATWYQRAVGYVGYGSGWLVEETQPGFFYSTARLNDGSTLIGLPGVQAWYRL